MEVAAPSPAAVPRHVLAGAVNALTATAVLLALGMVASAALGPAAAHVGIRAAFAGVIAGGLVYALGGTSPAPAGGPTTATTVILAALVLQVGRDPSLDLTAPAGVPALVAVVASAVVLMGVLQIAFGLAGLGRLARFVSQPVLAGFMNGVALVILIGQLRPLLGLPPTMPLADPRSWSQAEPLALALGVVTALAIWVLGPRWRAVPAPLTGLAAGVVAYLVLLRLLPGGAFGSVIGAMPQGWALPDALAPLADGATRALWQRHAGAVVQTAVVLALIGSLESLFAALALDQQAGSRHDSRRELLALGAANVAGGLCGGLPLALVRSRAASLIDGGAAGRTATIVAVSTFALLYAFGGRWLAYLPTAVLAGAMVTIAVALSDRWTRQLLRQWRGGERSPELRLSLLVVAAVCAVTVALGSAAGVAAGVLLSTLVFIRTMNRSLLRDRFDADRRPSRRIWRPQQEAVLASARRRITVFELEGALFFGSSARLDAECETLAAGCRCLVLDFRRVSTIDESGALALQDLSHRLQRRGVVLLMAGVAAGNRHGQRLRAFGCFREEPRTDWWPDADRATEAAELHLLAEAGAADAPAAVPLAESALLQGLDAAGCARVSALLRERRLRPGELLFDEGDPGDALYVLGAGSVSVVAAGSPTGQRFVSFSPGMMFGETAMLDGSGRTAAAVADGDAVVHALARDDFMTLSEAHPALAQRLTINIAIHLAQRLRSAATAWRASAG